MKFMIGAGMIPKQSWIQHAEVGKWEIPSKSGICLWTNHWFLMGFHVADFLGILTIMIHRDSTIMFQEKWKFLGTYPLVICYIAIENGYLVR